MWEGFIAIGLFLMGQLILALIWGSAITVKVDTLWNFLMRRGIVEATQKGLGVINSPFTLSTDTKEWLLNHPIVSDIKKFCGNNGKGISNVDLAVKIERKFGERIVKEICIPKNISDGACLVLALEAARIERRLKNTEHFPERRRK